MSNRTSRRSSTFQDTDHGPSTTKAGPPRLYYDGEDRTPLSLVPKDKAVQMIEKSRSESVSSLSFFDFKIFNTAQFYNDLHNATNHAESVLQQKQLAGLINEFSTAPLFETIEFPLYVHHLEEEVEGEWEEDEDDTVSFLDATRDSQIERASSVVPEVVAEVAQVQRVKVTLLETNTNIYFEMPSVTIDRDDEEADAIEAANRHYDFLTIGKGRNRKTTNVEVQTHPLLRKSRSTQATVPETETRGTFVSDWILYDFYKEMDAAQTDKKHEQEAETDNSGSNPINDALSYVQREMLKLIRHRRFLDAVCVTERLLANNVFNEQQKRYKGLSDPQPFRESIEYNYRLNLLWTFKNNQTTGRSVSAIAFNAANEDILAVGYGKFYFNDHTTGIVMLWNLKNPVQPERTYHFPDPVTALDFARKSPNLLAVGFFNGSVKLLDVSSYATRIVAESSSRSSPSFEPIWKVTWYQGQDYHKGKEMIMTSCQDGRINNYSIVGKQQLSCSRIMRVTRPEGQLQGIETLQRNHIPTIPICKYAAALVFEEDPTDPNIYYVGTNEGTVHKCSKNYFHQHIDIFLAHDGPMYAIKFSPFCDHVFLTCGDDWTIRIWAIGVVEPLLELCRTLQSIQDADWCPTHSTIIASICGPDIFIWDLQRKAYFPQSVRASPANYRNTIVKFTPSGRCLIVGDIDGNVHAFSLEDMPFPAFFQSDLLVSSIVRNLITREDLVKKLRKHMPAAADTNQNNPIKMRPSVSTTNSYR